VRPSDENQHGTTRPNLMSSSRRSSNSDESILAKMDRARGLSTRARTIWLAGAGGLIALLIAAIGTLAYTNSRTPRVLPVDNASAAPPPPGSFDMPHSEAPAQIVNVAPHDDPAATPAALPPLVILPRASAPLPPVATLARASAAPAPLSAPMPPPVYAARPPAPMSPAPIPAPARSVVAAPKLPPQQARPAPARVAAAKKPKPPVLVADRPESPPVDLDVALISAVVASRHRAEAAACADSTRCPPKP
jgi:hypothetical protein